MAGGATGKVGATWLREAKLGSGARWSQQQTTMERSRQNLAVGDGEGGAQRQNPVGADEEAQGRGEKKNKK